MKRVYFDGQLRCGAYVKNASVLLPDDYTMRQLVTAIARKGFESFMTSTMHRLVEINVVSDSLCITL